MNQKLRMLSSREGSPDGIRVQWFLEGKTYDVTPSLAAIFLKEGWAEEVTDEDPLPEAGAKQEVAPTPKQEYSSKKRR